MIKTIDKMNNGSTGIVIAMLKASADVCTNLVIELASHVITDAVILLKTLLKTGMTEA